MTRRIQFAVITGFSALLFSACAAPPEKVETVDKAKLTTEIQAMEDSYSAAEKAKDAAGVVTYYSDDAISYNRNESPVIGKEAIKARTAERLAKDTAGNTSVYKVVDLFAEGNSAVEIGSWTLMNAAGQEIDKGHYMSYFQKRDGKYVCVRDMNVSSNPAVPK